MILGAAPPVSDIVIFGLVSAAIYAVAASGLVVTYTTSGIFNFAHGAVAMVCAFVYWQLSSPDAWGLPVPLALVLTVLVFAPAFGLFIDWLLMRGLDDAAPITRLVIPIGLTVALIQLAFVIWPQSTVQARLPHFFEGETVEIAGVAVTYHNLIVFATAILVAIVLRIVLYRTRMGVAMRAVVDNRELAALNGVSPSRVSGAAWALGFTLAGVAGVLVAPILELDQTQLTFLVINAYAAAMVGRLRSLPLTAVGAIILGITRQTVDAYSTSLPSWLTVETVPAIMLFVVLIVVPQDKAEVFSNRRDRMKVPNPSWRKVAIGAALLVGAALVIPSFVSPGASDQVGKGLALAIVALSLVPLTGYAGQISLAPLAFAGIGAVVMAEWGSNGEPLALVAVVVVCAAVGALVALPTLRLKGLYLALATFAFATFVEKVMKQNPTWAQGTAAFARLDLGPISVASDRAYLVLLASVFAAMGALVIALRKGPMGRRLQAMKDSPAACATLGLSTSRLKLQVFALSAAMAGIGGALYGGWRGQLGVEQFALLQGELPGLPLVLMAVVGGIAAVGGALLGGVLLAVFPLIGEYYPFLKDFMTVLPGLAGISLANNPDGAIAQAVTQVQASFDPARRDRPLGSKLDHMLNLLLPPVQRSHPEALPVGASASVADIATADAELGLDWGRCHADPGDR